MIIQALGHSKFWYILQKYKGTIKWLLLDVCFDMSISHADPHYDCFIGTLVWNMFYFSP